MVGEILEALEQNGLADDTIVVLFGDHGYTLGEHFMYGKVNLWEQVTRVPFVMRVPGMTKAGTKTKGLVELLDIYPTLCELTGLSTPSDLEGESLVPMLKRMDRFGKEVAYTVVSRYPDKKTNKRVLGRSIRNGDWRYTEWGPKREAELYNLRLDAEEYTNLAVNPKYAKQVKRLKLLLEKERRSDH